MTQGTVFIQLLLVQHFGGVVMSRAVHTDFDFFLLHLKQKAFI